MNLYSSREVAVSGHLDWPMGILLMTALAISVVLAVTAARLWVASVPDGKRRWYAVAIGLGAMASLTQVVSLWIVVRHLEQYLMASAVAMSVVVAVAAAAFSAVRGDLERRPESDRFLVSNAVLAAPIVVSSGIAAVILIVDGYGRAPAAVIIAFLALGAFALVAVAAKIFWPRMVRPSRP